VWTELSLGATSEAVDWVKTLLAPIDPPIDLNVNSAPEPEAEWAWRIRFYLPAGGQSRSRTEAIATLLSPLQRTGLTSDLQILSVATIPPPSDLPVQQIGDRVVILSPAAAYQPAPDQVVLKIGPGLAFGSGLHPATIVSLRLLERHVRPNLQALDLGSGSGILSVAMAKLGARVLALDNDEIAVAATQAAVEQNQVESLVTVQAGSLGQGSTMGHWMGGGAIAASPAFTPVQAFDCIAANVLARIHITLAADYSQGLRPGGVLITAGFTTDYADQVDAALVEAGLVPIDRESLHEWIGLAHQLPHPYTL
jgi:ribosomal protein L11 methyltransferase